MAKGKVNVLLIVGAGALAYYLWQKNKTANRVSVTADNPVKQSAEEFEQDYQEAEVVQTRDTTAATTPLQVVSSLVSKIFPKKSKEQKAAKKTARVAKRTAKKAKKKVAGFDDLSILY